MKNAKWIGLGVVVILVIAGAFFLGQGSANKQSSSSTAGTNNNANGSPSAAAVSQTLPVVATSTNSANAAAFAITVPGDRSTCYWTWLQSDGTSTIVTQEPGPNALHTLSYPTKNGFTNFQVTCKNNLGVTYSGAFPSK